jgi:type I restriction enzyme S subunit
MSDVAIRAATVRERVVPGLFGQATVGDGFGVEEFLRNFETIAESEGGVKLLRGMVLDLAVRGRLTRRRDVDDRVEDLFDKAAIDRNERLKRGVAKQMAALEDVSTSEAPLDLPEAWQWTRIGLAMNLVNGRAFKPKDWSNSGLPIIRIQNLNNSNALFNYCGFEVEPKHYVSPGDLLISWSGTPGTSFGAFVWFGARGVLNQHIFRAEVYGASYDLKFLSFAINSRLGAMIAQAHGGVGLQHITKGKLESMPVPLPPLAEQKRIVAKVDALMALCDELEARQAQKRELGARLTGAALGALTSAEGPEEFDAAWARVAGSFATVVDRSEKVAEVRRAIVELALNGKLASPSDADRRETAWRSVTLSSIIEIGPKNGYSPKGVNYPTSVKSVTLTATTSGAFDGRHFKYIDENIADDSSLWLRDGDILVQRGNTIEYVGVAAVYRGPAHAFIYPDLMMKIRIVTSVDVDFVHMALNGSMAREFMRSRASGTSGSMPKINQATLMSVPILLPPLAEQKRIVAKVDQLMALCDELETGLRRAEEAAAALAKAAVAVVVG